MTGGTITAVTLEREEPDMTLTADMSPEQLLWLSHSRDELLHLTIAPDSQEAVTVGMLGGNMGRDCFNHAHICNQYGKHLSNSFEHAIAGPAMITVSDDSAREGTNNSVTFTVRLSKPMSHDVTIRWQTQDQTAVSTGDYEAASGTLTSWPARPAGPSPSASGTTTGTRATRSSDSS